MHCEEYLDEIQPKETASELDTVSPASLAEEVGYDVAKIYWALEAFGVWSFQNTSLSN